jgi:hypothetical protein
MLHVAGPAVHEVDLSTDHVVPRGRVRILEIGHENTGAGIKRVEHHLAVGGAGDLDAAVLKIVGNGADFPFGGAD